MRDPELRALIAGRDVFLMMSRLLGKEIDRPLYRTLLAADAQATASETLLIGAETRSLGEEEALQTLSAEYCRLFVGPRPVCLPYESVYRGEAVIGGRAEHRIKMFMEHHRVEAVIPTAYPLLAYDHLAIGLAVLHHLLDVCAEPFAGTSARGRARDAVRRLMDDHLLAWAPSFLNDLHVTARFEPYAGVAGFTARLMLEQ
ncbi:TorD/DmsD family molecular chaperone [Planomonospora parontospora]|uniref:TorD/DmsD family molecular chaperone n=1 Tax=Planomonospora parontospora TaxID=58119 RepID=UPI001670E578|nr:molecular chaperone TorD family protein [Planomonospora parontospora]GGL40819.1 molecular chaperone TorD [Planomonospora parontospora subsp. antibiotica]GII18210.1 molecular chaperone TorD [Planomonospora parontospora subsp. antibiotica]